MLRAQDIQEILEEAEIAVKDGDEAYAGVLLDMAGEGLEVKQQRLQLLDARRGEILKKLRKDTEASTQKTARATEEATVHEDRYAQN